jgi:hypothetical protein
MLRWHFGSLEEFGWRQSEGGLSLSRTGLSESGLQLRSLVPSFFPGENGAACQSCCPKFKCLFQLTPVRCGIASSSDRDQGFPRQQSQSGSLPPAPVEVGRFHACGAPKRRWQQRRFCPRPPKAGLRFKEEAWPHPRKWMLSGELMSSGSRLASPRAKTTNSTTKPRKSCERRWLEKTNPARNNQKRLAHGAAA